MLNAIFTVIIFKELQFLQFISLNKHVNMQQYIFHALKKNDKMFHLSNLRGVMNSSAACTVNGPEDQIEMVGLVGD